MNSFTKLYTIFITFCLKKNLLLMNVRMSQMILLLRMIRHQILIHQKNLLRYMMKKTCCYYMKVMNMRNFFRYCFVMGQSIWVSYNLKLDIDLLSPEELLLTLLEFWFEP